ncbi:MAG: KH domain-containing protein [Fastidiosipilaceae bacterium]|jgi:predicted RNA-binding protein YlqC (UPF0109 family)
MNNDATQMKELLVTLITPLVNYPEDIRVTPVEQGNTIVVEVRVAPSDMGKVIGKKGVRAQAIRQVMKSYANSLRRRVVVDISD